MRGAPPPRPPPTPRLGRMSTTFFFYMAVGVLGYMALGPSVPDNVLLVRLLRGAEEGTGLGLCGRGSVGWLVSARGTHAHSCFAQGPPPPPPPAARRARAGVPQRPDVGQRGREHDAAGAPYPGLPSVRT